MNKTLTTATVRTLKPARDRREIPDAGCRGLYLVVEPTGRKSWAMRARRPDRRPGKLRLGTVDVAEGHVADPKVGGHLTLPSARKLVGNLQNELASGKDVFAEHKEERRRMASKFDAASAATFPRMAQDFVERHLRDRKGIRTWWKAALVLGLDYGQSAVHPKDRTGPDRDPRLPLRPVGISHRRRHHQDRHSRRRRRGPVDRHPRPRDSDQGSVRPARARDGRCPGRHVRLAAPPPRRDRRRPDCVTPRRRYRRASATASSPTTNCAPCGARATASTRCSPE